VPEEGDAEQRIERVRDGLFALRRYPQSIPRMRRLAWALAFLVVAVVLVVDALFFLAIERR
jgi:hypothetical protein